MKINIKILTLAIRDCILYTALLALVITLIFSFASCSNGRHTMGCAREQGFSGYDGGQYHKADKMVKRVSY